MQKKRGHFKLLTYHIVCTTIVTLLRLKQDILIDFFWSLDALDYLYQKYGKTARDSE